jgi:hypothetical protein
MKIDWKLFKKQKWALIGLAGKSTTTPEEVHALDGVINMMDAIQDEDQPEVCDSDVVDLEDLEDVAMPVVDKLNRVQPHAPNARFGDDRPVIIMLDELGEGVLR